MCVFITVVSASVLSLMKLYNRWSTKILSFYPYFSSILIFLFIFFISFILFRSLLTCKTILNPPKKMKAYFSSYSYSLSLSTIKCVNIFDNYVSFSWTENILINGYLLRHDYISSIVSLFMSSTYNDSNYSIKSGRYGLYTIKQFDGSNYKLCALNCY